MLRHIVKDRIQGYRVGRRTVAKAGARYHIEVSQVFISYARSTALQAKQIAEALRAHGYTVWRDDELPVHRAYAEVIAERLKMALAVVVVWSADAVESEWVQSEADRARAERKLVQLTLDGAPLPMPFDRLQCADLIGWQGDTDCDGWSKVVASVAELVGTSPTMKRPTPVAKLVLPAKPSIAVLPFANLSTDASQVYFADGMVEEITDALARFRTLFVIASSAASAYRDGARDLKIIGQELGVRYLLEGSVRKAADKVRISVQLVEAHGGAQIWSHRFDDTFEDVFALQDRVAGAVAGVLDATLETAEIRRAARRPTADLDAYDLYLQAVSHFRSSGRESVARAVQLADAAVARDPNFACALVLAALGRSSASFIGSLDDLDACRRQGLEQCSRAVSLAPDDPLVLAYAALTLMNFLDDIEVAQRLSERAFTIVPGSAMTLHANGWLHAVNGDPALAIARLEQALRLDPSSSLNPYHLTGIGVALFALGRFDEAVTHFSDALLAVPDYPTPRVFRAASQAYLGRRIEAAADLAKLHACTLDFMLHLQRDPARVSKLRAGLALAREPHAV